MQKKNLDHLLSETVKILKDLIGFKTISGHKNLDLISYCEEKLNSLGAKSLRTYSANKLQANLFSTLGENKGKGIILSGHTDVVPASSGDWTSDPFIAREKEERTSRSSEVVWVFRQLLLLLSRISSRVSILVSRSAPSKYV